MSDTVIVALIGLAGSACGSFIGIAVNSRMMSYRLEQLEKRFDELVNKHGTFETRLAALESRTTVQDEQIRQIGHQLEEMERKVANV